MNIVEAIKTLVEATGEYVDNAYEGDEWDDPEVQKWEAKHREAMKVSLEFAQQIADIGNAPYQDPVSPGSGIWG